MTLGAILEMCGRHKTVRSLRLSHCDLGQDALRQLRDGARWLCDLGIYKVQGITEAEVAETKAGGFTLGP